jgi:hypothetical protein
MAEPSVPTDGPETPDTTPSPAPREQVFVQANEIEIPRPDATIISSASLVDQLVRNQDDTVRFLSENVADVTIEDISVDQHGRVVIANQLFRENLLVELGTLAPEKVNVGICGDISC